MRSILFVALLSTGCVVGLEDAGDEVAGEAGDDGTSSRIALNGLTANTTMSVTTDPSPLRTLSQGSLASAGTRVPAMFSTAEGRDQFAYLYSCAESVGRSLTVSANGTSYTFAGGLGLAPEWTTSFLASYKYKLMTACMLARTNYRGITVQISMRNLKIPTALSEVTNFGVLEGAFWGDAFTAGGSLRACPSPAKLAGAKTSTLPLRECTVSKDGVTTKCSFGYAGECSKVCVSDLTNALGYSGCEGNADTIAVYVANP